MFFLFALAVLTTVLSCDTYTMTTDNSSVKFPETDINMSVITYHSFKQNCFKGSENKQPIEIPIRVFPSYPLFTQYGKNGKRMKLYVGSLFNEVNKIYTSQLNLKLVPTTIIPKITDPAPITKPINVIGDLQSFGVFSQKVKSRFPYNLFLHNGYTNIVGASWVGVVWGTSLNVGVSLNEHTVMAHEIGHAFGAVHSFDTGGLMSYSNRIIDGAVQFSEENRPQLCAYLKTHYG